METDRHSSRRKRVGGTAASSLAEHDDDEMASDEVSRGTREFLAELLRTIGALVIVLDRHGRIVSFNRACEEATGYTFAEVRGRCFWDFLLRADEVEPVKAVFAGLVAGSFPNEHENDWVAKDGSLLSIRWTNSCLTDAAGSIEYIIGTGIDITERRAAREQVEGLNRQLQRRVAELQAILETAPAGLAIAEDATGHHIRGNAIIEQMMDVRPGGELSKAGPRPAAYRCFDQRGELAATHLPMQRAVRGETVRGQIIDVVREDGQRITLHGSASPLFDDAGQVNGAVGAFLDITALRRAEQRTRILSEVAAELLATNRPQDAVEAICRRVMDYLECDVFFNYLVEEHPGRLHLNACAGVSDDVARQIEWLDYGIAVCGCAARDGCRIVVEHVQTTRDPRADLVRSYGVRAYACHPLMNEGAVMGTLSFGSREKETFTDEELALMKAVTDHVALAMQRLRLMQSLDRHARLAEAANEAKSRFLANMSHELRTPMNAILGMIDVALQATADAMVQDCLHTAKDSAQLLMRQLNDLLDTAKIESGRMELEVLPFSLRRMLRRVERLVSNAARDKGLSFGCDVPQDVPDAVEGDRLRLEQVLLNLCGNAVKFTEQGEVEIQVRAVTRGDEALLEFSVRDTGIGIAPATLPRLFEPFTQSDPSTTRRFGGTGLGLSICKSLVEMMGGHIGVTSEVGKGSIFNCTIPLRVTEQLPDAVDAPPLPLAVARKPLRILLVEDNPANRKLATLLLGARGHVVDSAEDGHAALLLADQNAYDAILMDVQMPGMNGVEVTKAIRRRELPGERVPIVAMTAHAMKEDRARFLAAGMDGYLAKPFDAQEMIALVESMAHHRGDAPEEPEPVPRASRPPLYATTVVFDPDEALAQCFGSSAMLTEMIQSFFDDVRDLLGQLRAALEAGDLIQVGQLGHRMKGTIIYLGAAHAKDAARRVEEFAFEAGGTPDEAESAVRALECECKLLKEALLNYRGAVDVPSSTP